MLINIISAIQRLKDMISLGLQYICDNNLFVSSFFRKKIKEMVIFTLYFNFTLYIQRGKLIRHICNIFVNQYFFYGLSESIISLGVSKQKECRTQMKITIILSTMYKQHLCINNINIMLLLKICD